MPQPPKTYLREELLKRGIESDIFPKKLYKFRNFGTRTNEIIEKSEFYFALPSSFNDPFDCNLSYNEIYSEAEILQRYTYLSSKSDFPVESYIQKYSTNQEKFVENFNRLNRQLFNQCGILSLSKTDDNITMWSHYANNHTGLAFELDVSKDYDFFDGYGVVEYKEEYELLSYTENPKDSLATLFLTKYTDWEYEQEVRIIDYEKNGSRNFNKSALSKIIFGCKATEENISEIINLCQKYGYCHTTFSKAEMKKGLFGLDFVDFDKSKYI